MNRIESSPPAPPPGPPLYYTNLQAPFSRAAVRSILRDLKKEKRKRRCLKNIFWVLFCLSMVGGMGTLAYFQFRTSSVAQEEGESLNSKELQEQIKELALKDQELEGKTKKQWGQLGPNPPLLHL